MFRLCYVSCRTYISYGKHPIFQNVKTCTPPLSYNLTNLSFIILVYCICCCMIYTILTTYDISGYSIHISTPNDKFVIFKVVKFGLFKT